MRDFASCFSDHAVKVADASCSGNSGGSTATEPSAQAAVTSLYKTILSSGKALLIRLTWSITNAGPSFSIAVEDDPDFSNPWRQTSVKPRLPRKKKGTHSFLVGSFSASLQWDFSDARFSRGPEPTDNFYVAVAVEAELALLLGDQNTEFLNRFHEEIPVAESSLLCRREQVVGPLLHSIIRTRFGEGSRAHEITIKCTGSGWEDRQAELSVFVDKKRVVHVTKLKWNFRGNQTIFIDGSPVDMMWDMHGWWFSSLLGHSVFLFRRRSSAESRLWLEEQHTVGFSLLVQAFRSP
ncbi:hypothetical protein HPP92_006427 [Vanilla planifolia]|uniref:Uncharacterized protein n=1 Tax=Vanilla planifolia TaxID=51239 RepID=A0A835VA03_VANPL|nr:hypothetical protein HPP92_006427 [Vanilla planifolia]